MASAGGGSLTSSALPNHGGGPMTTATATATRRETYRCWYRKDPADTWRVVANGLTVAGCWQNKPKDLPGQYQVRVASEGPPPAVALSAVATARQAELSKTITHLTWVQ